MYIEDLKRFPPDHPPSPYNIPVSVQRGGTWGYGKVPAGLVLCAVGWLDNSIPRTGEVPRQVIGQLWDAFRKKKFVVDGTAGWHDCGLCSGEEAWYPGGKVGPVVRWGWRRERIRGYGHFLVVHGDVLYMAPILILHYILDHGYRPPDEFLAAVAEGDLLGPDGLDWDAP